MGQQLGRKPKNVFDLGGLITGALLAGSATAMFYVLYSVPTWSDHKGEWWWDFFALFSLVAVALGLEQMFYSLSTLKRR